MNKTAKRHLKICDDCLTRMQRGLELLNRDDQCSLVFARMNQAILAQQITYSQVTEKTREWVFDTDKKLKLDTASPNRELNASKRQWRPFQLAFILMSISSIVLQDEQAFEERVAQGRTRLGLIAQEVARLSAQILQEFAQVSRRLKELKSNPAAAQDMQAQLGRLMHAQFMRDTPYSQLQHFPRYLQAIAMRIDKLRKDPAKDQQLQRDVQTLEQGYWRLVAQRKGQTDSAMEQFRWLLEELRVGLFAQTLRTPQPVSVKRLEKAWQAMQR